MIARASRWLDTKINHADHATRKRCTVTPCLAESWWRNEMKQVLRNRGWMSMGRIGVSTISACKCARSEAPGSVPRDVKKAATYFKRACDQWDEIGCSGAKRQTNGSVVRQSMRRLVEADGVVGRAPRLTHRRGIEAEL